MGRCMDGMRWYRVVHLLLLRPVYGDDRSVSGAVLLRRAVLALTATTHHDVALHEAHT